MIDDRLRTAAAELREALGTPRAPALPTREPHGRAVACVVAVAGIAVGAVVISMRDDTERTVTVTPSVVVPEPTSSTLPATSEPTTTTFGIESTTTSPSERTHLQAPLSSGSTGDEVVEVQARLTELGFAPGAIDGVFGALTTQAVWAFEKLVELVHPSEATGIVTDHMWQTMQSEIVIQPRRPGEGTHVEVYLPQQVAAVFTDDRPVLVMHISSGAALDRNGPPSWCENTAIDTDDNGEPLAPPHWQAVCGVSFTPGGTFSVLRALTGLHRGSLECMLDPAYINYGIAIHGASNVPLEPASHGGIRIANALTEVFRDTVHVGDRVSVWGRDGKEPEEYTKDESLPVFPYADPNPPPTLTNVGDQDCVAMPLLNGLLLDNGLDLLEEAGLTASPITYEPVPPGDPNDGRIIRQGVPVGQILAPGTAIEVVVGAAA